MADGATWIAAGAAAVAAGAAVVQAGGALWLFKHSNDLWERTAKAELQRTHAAIDLFGSTLVSTLADLRDACRTQQFHRIQRFQRKLAEVIRVGQAIRIDSVPRDCMADFMDVMAHAIEVARLLEPFTGVSGVQSMEAATENARAEVSFLMSRIGAHLNGWPIPEKPKG